MRLEYSNIDAGHFTQFCIPCMARNSFWLREVFGGLKYVFKGIFLPEIMSFMLTYCQRWIQTSASVYSCVVREDDNTSHSMKTASSISERKLWSTLSPAHCMKVWLSGDKVTQYLEFEQLNCRNSSYDTETTKWLGSELSHFERKYDLSRNSVQTNWKNHRVWLHCSKNSLSYARLFCSAFWNARRQNSLRSGLLNLFSSIILLMGFFDGYIFFLIWFFKNFLSYQRSSCLDDALWVKRFLLLEAITPFLSQKTLCHIP